MPDHPSSGQIICRRLSRLDIDSSKIGRRKGEKPSPGTIYPALKNLREMGFISSEDEKEGKTITYTLTERGKNALRISKRRFIRIFLEFFLRAATINLSWNCCLLILRP